MLRDRTAAAEAFTAFVDANEAPLRRALTAGFGSEAGREAAAEALAYGWQHWDRVSSMENPAGYLFRVGQNAARRAAAPRRWFGREEIVYDQPWIEPGFRSAWSSLSDQQRTVAGLIHGFDWSFAEVAEFLGVAKSTVQKHEQRAMSRLRRHLGVEQ